MRVALNGYFWDQPRTGSGQYLRHLWNAFSQVTLPTESLPLQRLTSELDMVLMLLPRDQVLTLNSAQIQNPKSKIQKLTWESWGIMSRAVRQHVDLLHVPYLSAPWAKKVPVVVTAHDMIPWVVPGYEGSPAVRIYLMLAAAAAKRANLIIADSDASRRDVIRVLKVSPSRVHTVYLGADSHPNYTPEQLEEVRARHGLPPDYAFYLGGFDLRKNVPLLLRAWKGASESLAGERCAEHKPVLAIGGEVPQPGSVFPDVRGEVARLGLLGDNSSVRFLGRISEEDKPMLMAGARLFIYPSAYEGFGLDPLEAMSVGCAVVSSSGGSLQEVVGDGGLLVPPGDETALRDAIVRTWKDDALRAELSRCGKERARTFTWQRTAEQTANLYSMVMQNARKR